MACSLCGMPHHQPYDDGLVECRNKLAFELSETRDDVDTLRARLAEVERERDEARGRAEEREACAREKPPSFEHPTTCNDCGECWDEAGWVTCPRCQVTTLRADLARVTAERDSAIEAAQGANNRAADIEAKNEYLRGCVHDAEFRCQAAEAERDEARAWYRACAEAIDVMFVADGHASEPGPVEAVVEHIQEAVDHSHRFIDAEAERDRMRAVVEAARNVVAQWRGDISRKPHIGQLRAALAAQGPGFLRCWRLRGHDGAHHDPIQGIDWTAEPNGNEERVK